jgi:hypothetical protein
MADSARHVLGVDIAGIANAFAKCGQIACTISQRRTAEKSDHRHRRLLRAAASGHAAALLILNIPAATVKTRMFYARKKLAELSKRLKPPFV